MVGGFVTKRADLVNMFSPSWIKHLGIDFEKWPRKIGTPKPGGEGRSPFWQPEVLTEEEYVNRIASLVNGRDIYTQLYSDVQRGASRWDKIYIDLDICQQHPTLEDVYGVMVEIVTLSRGLYNKTPRVNFSGTKGFAIYFDFDPVVCKIHTLKTWVEERIIDRLGITLDTTVLGDKSRISRIPYTMNYNSLKYRVCESCLMEWRVDKKILGQLQGDLCPNCQIPGILYDPVRACIPVDPDWSLEYMISEATKPSEYYPVLIEEFHEIAKELIELDATVVDPAPHDSTYSMDAENSRRTLQHLKACGKKLVDGRHRLMGFIIIPSLLEVYWGDEDRDAKVMSWCMKWLDLTGANSTLYQHYILQTISRTLKGPDGMGTRPWAPWSLDKFMLKYPEMIEMLLLDAPNGLSDEQMGKLETYTIIGFQILQDSIQGEVRSKRSEAIYSCGWTKRDGPWCTCEAGTRNVNCAHAGALLLRAIRQSDFVFVNFLMDWKKGDKDA